MLVALANTDLFEQMEVGDGSRNNNERSNQGKITGKQSEVPTPLKAEKSLKRHYAEIVDMDVDSITKKPRISEQSK